MGSVGLAKKSEKQDAFRNAGQKERALTSLPLPGIHQDNHFEIQLPQRPHAADVKFIQYLKQLNNADPPPIQSMVAGQTLVLNKSWWILGAD